MKNLALVTLVGALGVGIFTVPITAAAQRESPLPVATRMERAPALVKTGLGRDSGGRPRPRGAGEAEVE